MWRYGFTLWFALTTLLGPGVCYRSLSAQVFAGAPRPPATLVTPPAAGPVRPARGEVAAGGPVGEASKTAPAPAKCPPGVGKRASGLQPRTASDLATDLRLAAGALPALPAARALDARSAAALLGSSEPSPFTRLSGRDVLTAYCLLRC